MVPTDRRYLSSHEWAQLAGDVVVLGITSFAVEHLSDLTFISLPEVGTSLEKGDRFGEIESVKAVSELFTPVSGDVVAANEDLADNVDTISTDPFGEGWMVKIKPRNTAELEDMLDAAAYKQQIEQESE
jgi:glycine cleavage system H protein